MHLTLFYPIAFVLESSGYRRQLVNIQSAILRLLASTSNQQASYPRKFEATDEDLAYLRSDRLDERLRWVPTGEKVKAVTGRVSWTRLHSFFVLDFALFRMETSKLNPLEIMLQACDTGFFDLTQLIGEGRSNPRRVVSFVAPLPACWG